jgi:hypothetical protein
MAGKNVQARKKRANKTMYRYFWAVGVSVLSAGIVSWAQNTSNWFPITAAGVVILFYGARGGGDE